VSTFCCCLPLSIASIVFAAQVDSKWAGGDHAGALSSANNAKILFWLSFTLGLLGYGAYFGLVILGTAAQSIH
jgi:hypothetical protein